jgi:hypothetical protein
MENQNEDILNISPLVEPANSFWDEFDFPPFAREKEIIFYSPVYDKNRNLTDVKINYTKYHELLLSFGLCRFDIKDDFIMVRIQNNIIEEVKTNTIQDIFFEYLNSLPPMLDCDIPRDLLIEKFNKSPETYFSKKRFSLLRSNSKYKFMTDTKNSCFIYFQNGFVECTANGWQLKDYNELSGCIWKNQILSREFTYHDVEDAPLGIFAQFIFNVSNKDETRFKSLRTIIGYMLHTYTEGKLRAPILTDSRISEYPDGRSGKSLIIQALSKVKQTCIIKGKDFDPKDKFKYQEAELDNQILSIDDVHKQFDFEMLFNDITEGIKVNKKNLQPFTIRPKLILTTNRTIKIEGASAKDRCIEFELADYYSDILSPEDEFKKWFFGDGFTTEDWTQFDNFIMACISYYLQVGLLNAPSISLTRRKLLESTNSDFVEFMDNQVANRLIIPGNEYCKQDLHKQFQQEYPDYAKDGRLSKLRTFTSYMKLYAKYTPGFAEVTQLDERKSNDKRFIRFMPQEKQTLILPMRNVLTSLS